MIYLFKYELLNRALPNLSNIPKWIIKYYLCILVYTRTRKFSILYENVFSR